MAQSSDGGRAAQGKHEVGTSQAGAGARRSGALPKQTGVRGRRLWPGAPGGREVRGQLLTGEREPNPAGC